MRVFSCLSSSQDPEHKRKVTSVCANTGTSYQGCVIGDTESQDFPMFKANALHVVPHSSLHPVACLSSASGGHISDKNPKAAFLSFVYRQCDHEGISLQGGIIVPMRLR